MEPTISSVKTTINKKEASTYHGAYYINNQQQEEGIHISWSLPFQQSTTRRRHPHIMEPTISSVKENS
eukprot:7757719-Ditylum_brightwellii.AAC.1